MNASQPALPPTDLSRSFGKSSRSAGLRLPPRKAPGKPSERPETPVTHLPAQDPTVAPNASQTAKEAFTSDVEDASPADAGTDSPAQPRHTEPKRRPRQPKKSATAATAPKPPRAATKSLALVLWTPVSIRARMQSVRGNEGTNYLNQVLDALESTVDQLPRLVATATTKPTVTGRLFVRENPAVGSTPTADEHRVQLTIRGALKSQLEVIDQLVEETGAGSRSALCNAALDAWLPA